MVQKLSEIPEVKEYQKTTKYQYDQLEKLEEQKNRHLEDIARYEQVAGELELLLSEKDDLQLERESLREEWDVASFDEDEDALDELRQRRKKIDDRIDEIDEQEQVFNKWLTENAVDREQVAKTIALTRMAANAEKPNAIALQRAIEASVKSNEQPIREQSLSIGHALIDYVAESEVDRVRREMDGAYKNEQESRERKSLAERELIEERKLHGGVSTGKRPAPFLNGTTIVNSVKAGGGERDLVAEGIV